MTGAQIHSAQIALERSIESGDYVTAQEMAVLLAPFVDAKCEALDRDPARKTQNWGVEA